MKDKITNIQQLNNEITNYLKSKKDCYQNNLIEIKSIEDSIDEMTNEINNNDSVFFPIEQRSDKSKIDQLIVKLNDLRTKNDLREKEINKYESYIESLEISIDLLNESICNRNVSRETEKQIIEDNGISKADLIGTDNYTENEVSNIKNEIKTVQFDKLCVNRNIAGILYLNSIDDIEKRNKLLNIYVNKIISEYNEKNSTYDQSNNQDLDSIIKKLEFCCKIVNQDPIRVKIELGTILNSLNNKENNIDNLIAKSYTDKREKFALFSSINKLIEKINKDNKYLVETNIKNVSRETKLNDKIIYHIIEECILNIHLHANASYIYISYIENNEELEIQINDNGCGFEVKDTYENKYGLELMKSRIEYLNGSRYINSTPGKGTQVKIVIPIIK